MRIAYLVSEYPSVSHTFIRREVAALRATGVEIVTTSVRRADPRTLASEEDRREAESTWSVLPAPPVALVAAHVRRAVRRPGAYVRTLGLALRHRLAGLRGALWALFHFAEAIRLADELERRGVTHLHSHFSNSGATVGLLAARCAGLGWSVTLHGSADFDGATRPLLGAKISAARFVRCVSWYGVAQALRVADPADWDKLFVARCGIDLRRFPLRPVEVRRGGRLRVLCVGRLSPEKGHLGLLEALARAVKGGLDAELVLIGDGPERARLEERAARLGLTDRLLLPGSRGEEDVARALADADVFALPSFMEGLPVVLVEAMACGVPVVAPRLAGIPELVEDGRTGLLYTPARWEELAASIGRLASEPGLGARLAAAGRRRVEEEFDVATAVAPLREALQRVG